MGVNVFAWQKNLCPAKVIAIPKILHRYGPGHQREKYFKFFAHMGTDSKV